MVARDTARRRSRCNVCGRWIEPGAVIMQWLGGWCHADCLPKVPPPRLHIERTKRPILRDTKLSPPISTPPDPRLTLPSVVAAREQARAEMAEAIAQARAERARRLRAGQSQDPDPCALPDPASPMEPGKGPPEPEKGGEVGEESSTLPPLTPEQAEQVAALERWQAESKSVLGRLVEERLARNGPPIRWMPGAIPPGSAEREKRRRKGK